MKIRGRNAAYQKSRVICAMSGGVDSSVSAAILKRNGYDVVGVFIIMSENSNPVDAKEVAKKLKIDFKILDVRKEFKKKVVDYFIDEYKKGRTPNPCVECNRWIKFRVLFNKTRELGADYIATGHYARTKNGKLLVAKDIKKDQSYFLWQLKQKQLAKIIFPIGDYTKTQIREMAKKWDLPIFEKKDSQNICFTVPRRSFKAKTGDIITTDGKKIGEHKGLVFYTIGQRKGIEIGGTGPYYVIRKDFKNNALIVSKSEKDLLSKEMIVKNVNWISGKPFIGKYKVKIRSTAPMVWTTVKKNKVVFDKLQRAITSGQSAVFYKGGELLGGGIIEK